MDRITIDKNKASKYILPIKFHERKTESIDVTGRNVTLLKLDKDLETMCDQIVSLYRNNSTDFNYMYYQSIVSSIVKQIFIMFNINIKNEHSILHTEIKSTIFSNGLDSVIIKYYAALCLLNVSYDHKNFRLISMLMFRIMTEFIPKSYKTLNSDTLYLLQILIYRKLSYTYPVFNSFALKQESYTPLQFVKLIKNLQVGVTMDVSSNPNSNVLINPLVYFNQHVSGLQNSWYGDVFCNPPFSGNDGTSVLSDWVDAMKRNVSKNEIRSLVVIVPHSPKSTWHAKFTEFAKEIKGIRLCFKKVFKVSEFLKGPSYPVATTIALEIMYYVPREDNFRSLFLISVMNYEL